MSFPPPSGNLHLVLYDVILSEAKTTSEGESRSHTCMAMTEPKRLGLAPSSEILNFVDGLQAAHQSLFGGAVGER